MLSYEQALQTLLAAATPVVGRETVDLLAAAGRVLASPIRASLDVPPADNSAMDGYALRVEDVAPGALLEVSQRIPAGSAPVALRPGTAARIFTGAPIPLGANAVVMQEKCIAEGEAVRVEHAPGVGENIRRAGEDIASGSVVLSAGTRLGAAHLGLLASIGVAQVEVFARLRIAVFFTGDELVTPGAPLRSGQIYNSNRYVLHGLLGALGCVVTDLGIVPDDLGATRSALREAAAGHDLVLTCGGVSVGEEDHVKAAVITEGALETWKIAIKPGKPFALGRVGETPFIGLPGNPVSSYATFLMLARPYIRRRQGETEVLPQAVQARADFSWPKAGGLREFLRVRRNQAGGLELFPKQGSGVLSSCAWADGLVSNPPGQIIQPGDLVSYIPLGDGL
ncbi:gephyrin-like molybdotransferase Glp [Uliginosibacterium sp. TH139]|uniref:molybdopterin molybdotransferase MoeA n=1 Tax=Uliginosibacterium sp. TH139 TaxID=2067453 RepID=UPI000C7B3300|nr:gephyrin-like molybdotransferase Glp [Uliginosibacterium sp. TH139]PLK48451.1 molybdopterin molybdenumtransferase MoeA [Uliginosibacterium sp. TH139]